MKLWVVGVIGLGLATACTKANPAVKCTSNGTCTDPNYPFCDVDGSVGGQPGTCIAVTCTAGQFKSCSGSDTALVCDASGMKLDPTSCVNGCADGSGCVTCTPNTQACASNVTTSCDGSGRLTTTTCSLGCSADATRCLKLVPSNNLGMYYDATTSPQDLDLENGTLELDAGTFNDGTTMTTLPSYDVAAPAGGAPIRVFVVKHLTLGNITITSTTAAMPGSGGVGRAVAFLATGDIDVTGRVAVQSGAVSVTGCNGSDGTATKVANGMSFIDYRSGGGGGAHASAGMAGGSIPGEVTGGAGGAPSSDSTLVPLRGGCPGGSGLAAGGGAIQLTSATMIHVTGAIIADGNGGSSSGATPGAGGAGGGILLEAPAVVVDATAKLLVRGGGGAAGNAAAPIPPDDASAPSGGTCSPAGPGCGDGGNGASTANATAGSTPAGGTSTIYRGGGGGGGRGYIRVNTLDGSFTPAAGAAIGGAFTSGTVVTI